MLYFFRGLCIYFNLVLTFGIVNVKSITEVIKKHRMLLCVCRDTIYAYRHNFMCLRDYLFIIAHLYNFLRNVFCYLVKAYQYNVTISRDVCFIF